MQPWPQASFPGRPTSNAPFPPLMPDWPNDFADGSHMDPHTDKLVRDSFIWSHLAGDSVSRMKVTRRIIN